MAFTFIQALTVPGIGNGQPTLTGTFRSPVAAGDLVVCGIECYYPSFAGISDNHSNTWTLVANQATGTFGIYFYWCRVATGGSTFSVTVTASAGNAEYGFALVDFTPSGAFGLDGSSSATGSGTTLAAGSFATTGTDVVVVFGGVGANGVMWTPATSYTIVASSPGGDNENNGLALAYQAGVPAGSIDPGLTCSASAPWMAAAAAFTIEAPFTTSAYVSKCGKTAYFFPVSLTATNGYYPPQVVTAVSSNPTFTWNGNAIAIGPPTWNDNDSLRKYPFVAYLLHCGGVSGVGITSGGTASYTGPTVTASGGGGSGATFGTPVLGTGVLEVTVAGATGYTSAPALTMTGGSWTTAPSFEAVYSGGSTFTIVPTVGGAAGNGTGVTEAPTFAATGGGGTYSSITVALGQYIQYVPVTAAGSGYTSQPTLTVTDSTGSGAVLTPVMSGVGAEDTLTYSAATGWLSCGLGSSNAATAAAVEIFTGQFEGQAGNLARFLPSSKTMRLGFNAGDGGGVYSGTCSQFADFSKKFQVGLSQGWRNAGTIVQDFDGSIASFTPAGATIYNQFYAGDGNSPIDSKNAPILAGTVTLLFIDPAIGSADAATVGLTFAGGNIGSVTSVTTQIGAVTQIAYTFAYVSSPTNYQIVYTFNYAQPQGLWTLTDYAVFPPGNAAAVAAWIAQPGYWAAVEGNYRALATTPAGQTPAVFRFMDCNASFGGASNYVDASDLPAPSDAAYGFQQGAGTISNLPPDNPAPGGANLDPDGNPILSGSINWTGYRCYNTNPGDGTYDHSSPHLYMSQLGSWAGAASGTDAVLGPYLTLPATDNGATLIGLFEGGQGQRICVELVSPVPHGLKTGQTVSFGAESVPIPVIGPEGQTTTTDFASISGYAYVTGETTAVFQQYVGLPGDAPSRVNATSTVACAIASVVQTPFLAGTPFEFSAAMASSLGSDLWISIPPFATDACSAAIAARVAANLTPGLKVYVEYGNENWNNDGPSNLALQLMSSMIAVMPGGARIGSYYTSDGSLLDIAPLSAIRTAAHHDTWHSTFAALSRGSDVVRVMGSWFSGEGSGDAISDLAAACNAYGIVVDAVAVAPYYTGLDADGGYSQQTNPSIVAACAPAGAQGVTPGNWPGDAILDLVGHAVQYHADFWAFWAADAAAIRTFTQSPRPELVGYEGMVQELLPWGAAIKHQLAYDLFYHPYFYDLITRMLGAMQVGNPTVAGSGLTLATLYQFMDQWNVDGKLWALGISTAQARGHGGSNAFAFAQCGGPADNQSHDLGNTLPGMQAANDWIAATEPTTPQVMAAPATLALGSVDSGFAGKTSSILVGGAGLTAALTLTAPAGVQLSLDNSSFSGSVTISPSGGLVATTPVYARIPASSPGTISGSIAAASAGAPTASILVGGTVIAGVELLYQSFAPGLPAGHASTAVVTPRVWSGQALSTPGTAYAGPVVEDSSCPGSYWCQVAYPPATLPYPSCPSVLWSVDGSAYVDHDPLGQSATAVVAANVVEYLGATPPTPDVPGVPIADLRLAQAVPTQALSQTVGGALSAALAKGETWAGTVFTTLNSDGSVFLTQTTNVAAPTGGVAPTSRV